MGSYTCMEFLRQYEVNRKTKKNPFQSDLLTKEEI